MGEERGFFKGAVALMAAFGLEFLKLLQVSLYVAADALLIDGQELELIRLGLERGGAAKAIWSAVVAEREHVVLDGAGPQTRSDSRCQHVLGIRPGRFINVTTPVVLGNGVGELLFHGGYGAKRALNTKTRLFATSHAAGYSGDEIWAFCYAKEKNLPATKQGKFRFGSIWTWTALDADTKFIASWMVGPRDTGAAHEFVRRNAWELSAAISGEPDRKHISASYLEPQNLTMDARAPVHQVDERLQQEAGKAHRRGLASLYALQLLPHSPDASE